MKNSTYSVRSRLRRDFARALNKSTSKQLHLERLEDRRLLASDLDFHLSSDPLASDNALANQSESSSAEQLASASEPRRSAPSLIEPEGPRYGDLDSFVTGGDVLRHSLPGELMLGVDAGADLLSILEQQPAGGPSLMGPLMVDRILTLQDGDGAFATEVIHLRFSSTDSIEDFVSAASELPNVQWAAPNYQYTGDIKELVPNDPLFAQQYHHALMGNIEAWDVTLGDPSVVIAVTDDGVQLDHPDLANNLWTNPAEANGLPGFDDDNNGFIDDIHGFDFVTNDGDPSPLNNNDTHGTHVSGIAAGQTNNNNQIAGTAGNASIMALRIAGSDGGFTSSIMANAFAFAIGHGAKIANTSFNIDFFVGDPTFTAGLEFYHDQGGLHFNSAGNNNALNPPRQAFDSTLLVASTGRNDIRSGFTNFGTGVDIAAPGSAILSTVTGGGVDTFSGTSMAAPNAAGVAALIWSANPSFTRDQVAAQLLATADNIDAQNPGFEGLLGAGRVNSNRALTETIAPPQIVSIEGLPDAGSTHASGTPLPSFTASFDQVMDTTKVNSPASYELRYAGANGVFGDADDAIFPVNVDSNYMVGSNEVNYSFGDGPYEIGSYRFSMLAAELTNPFAAQLDANSDGTGGDDFSREFNIGVAPLEQINAAGTLLYGTQAFGNVRAAGEIDDYALPLNSAQTVSLAVFPIDASLTPQVQLVDSSGAVLASGSASAAGEIASVTNVPIVDADDLEIQVSGIGGSLGEYTLDILVNGTYETENIGGVDNNSLENAQSLDSQFQEVASGVSVASVAGFDTNVGPSQTLPDVFSPRVLNYELSGFAEPTGAGNVIVTAVADLDLATEFLTLDVEGLFQTDIFVDDGAQGIEVETQVPVSLAQINTIIADGIGNFTLTPSALVNELNTPSFATVELRYPVADDFFSITLLAGETATFVVTGEGDPELSVLDAGILQGVGSQTEQIDQIVNNFTAPADGVFTVRVAGEGDYALSVAKGTNFDTELNDSFSTSQGPAPLLGFLQSSSQAAANVLTDFPGINSLNAFCGCEPPDTHAAAGPNHIVEVVNTAIAVYEKDGTEVMAPQSFLTFFDDSIIAGETFNFDPVVAYMEDVGRFAVAVLSGAQAGAQETDLLLAVSDSSDPTGGWTEQHRIDFGTISPGLFADYPKIGWNADGLFVTLNMFGNFFDDVNIVSIDKDSIVDNNRDTFTSFITERPGNHFTMAAATIHDGAADGPMWYVSETSLGGTKNAVRVVRQDDAVSASPLYSSFIVPVGTYQSGSLPNAPQPGGSRRSNDTRMLHAELRGTRLFAAHTVPIDGLPKARWYEFDVSNPNAPTLVQEVTIDPGAGIATYFPSIAVNAAGDVGVTYMQSSTEEFTSMYVSGQPAGAPLGSSTLPQLVMAGNQTFPGSRSGDYSGITVDPVTDTFWAANEVSLSGSPDPRWSTHIGEFTVAPLRDEDFATLPSQIGDTLTITTTLPLAGPNLPGNALDPELTLYAPDGTVVATDQDSLDGRNASIVYTADQTGEYRVEIASQNIESGEYFLGVAGATAADPAPEVEQVTPFDGFRTVSFPTSVTLDFSEQILLTSLSASDLIVGGLPATAVSVIDGDTIEFTIDPAANVGDGQYTVSLPAGSVTDLQGNDLVDAFSSVFVLDTTGPRIVSTSWNGQAFPTNAILDAGSLIFEATFNENLFTNRSARTGLRTPSSDDVILTDTNNGETWNPDALSFDSTTFNLVATFDDVPAGLYTMTLVSGDGAFEDDLGNDLDGEPTGAGSDGAPTGNGSNGGDYLINFELDLNTKEAGEFQRLAPLGSGLASSLNNAVRLHDASDTDGITFFANAGDTVSAIGRVQDPGATLSLELVGLGSASGSASGQPVAFAPITIPADGIYEFRLSATAETDALVEIYPGTTVELTVGDSTIDNPLPLGGSFSSVGPGRYAALARSLPATEDSVDSFEIDFTGKVGIPHDIVLTGLNADFSSDLLQVLAPDGGVLATGAADPLGTGTDASNIALAILGFVPQVDGVHRINLTAPGTEGQYSLVVTENYSFEIEGNNLLGPGLRSLDGVDTAVGFISGVSDSLFATRAEFEQVVGVLPTETFDNTSVPPGSVTFCTGPFSSASSDACFLPNAILPGIAVSDNPGPSAGGMVLLGTNQVQVGNTSPVVGPSSFDEGARLDFDPGVTAVGSDIWVTSTTNVAFEVLGNDGVVLQAGNLLVTAGQPSFFGVASESEIRTVLFSTTVGEVVDNVSFGRFLDQDVWTATYEAGEYVQLSAERIFEDARRSPANLIDPTIRVIHPDGSTVVAEDSGAINGIDAAVAFTAPADGVYSIIVESAGLVGEYRVGAPSDQVAPTVSDVIVASSAWSPEFIDIVDGGGQGGGNGLGVSIAGADQLRNLPWASGIDRIFIQFSEDVSNTWAPDMVAVAGTSAGAVGVNLGSYGQAGTNIATIELSSAILNDRLVVALSEDLTDPSGNRLDGEWATGNTSSGDGTQGGQFNFFFNVLAGDVDNSDGVNVSGDVLSTFNQVGNFPTTLAEAYFDVTHNGGVNVSGDVLTAFNLVGAILPGGQPVPPSLGPSGSGGSGGGFGDGAEGEGPDELETRLVDAYFEELAEKHAALI